MGGMVRFPVQPHSHEKIRVSMWRLHPDLPILDWKSYSPESPSCIHPSYRDRVRFRLDGEIELWAVGLGDQGTYEIETNYFDREPRNRDVEHFELRVVGSRCRWAIIPAVILLVLAVLGVWASYLCSNPHTVPDEERVVVGPGVLQSGDRCTRRVTEHPVSGCRGTGLLLRCLCGRCDQMCPWSQIPKFTTRPLWNMEQFPLCPCCRGVWGEGRNGVLTADDQP
ncbi:uncharacterized protein LOC144603054 isoform X1 [Rhinoraja longicauda]